MIVFNNIVKMSLDTTVEALAKDKTSRQKHLIHTSEVFGNKWDLFTKKLIDDR